MKPNTQAYFDLHKKTLLDMKEKAIASVILKRALKKMVYECPCGAVVGYKQLQYHFISKNIGASWATLLCPQMRPWKPNIQRVMVLPHRID